MLSPAGSASQLCTRRTGAGVSRRNGIVKEYASQKNQDQLPILSGKLVLGSRHRNKLARSQRQDPH